MKIKLLCVSLFTLKVIFPSLGQQPVFHRDAISVSGGYSLSVGKTINKLFEDSNGELAGDGYFAQIHYEHKFRHWLGAHLILNQNINNTRSEAVIDIFKSKAADFNIPAEILNALDYESDAGKWKMLGVYAGPSFHFYPGKFEIDVHASAGIVKVHSPEVSIRGALGNLRLGEGTLSSASNSGFGWGLGASARYPLGDKLKVFIKAEALASRVTLENVNITATANNVSITQPLNRKQNVGVVNLGVGLLWGL